MASFSAKGGARAMIKTKTVLRALLIVLAFLIIGVPLLYSVSIEVSKAVSGQRIREYFGIRASDPVNASTIQSAIASQVLAGSTVDEVHAYLQQAGIGKNKFMDSLIHTEKPQIDAWVDYGFVWYCNFAGFNIRFQFADAPLGRNADNHVIVLDHVDRLKEIGVEYTLESCL